MSKFVTPRVVSTIAQSRIDYNQSMVSLLENFSGTSAPISSDISLEGVTGLKTGMFWYKSGGDSSIGQNRFLVYDGSSFTRNGIGTFQMSSIAEANAAAIAGNIEYGDLVLVGDDVLYIVNSAETGVIPISGDAVTLSGLVSTQFLRSDIETTASANVFFTSNNFIQIPMGSTAQRPSGGKVAPGQIRFNEELNVYEGYNLTGWETLSSSSSAPAANTQNITANVLFTTGVESYFNQEFTFNPSTGEVSATSFNSTSDATLKENIEVIPDSLAKVKTLQGYLFNFVGQDKKSAGLIAQQVIEVLPEAVTMDSSGKLSINYSAVLGLVVQAFNEYIDNTEARLSNLESRLNER